MQQLQQTLELQIRYRWYYSASCLLQGQDRLKLLMQAKIVSLPREDIPLTSWYDSQAGIILIYVYYRSFSKSTLSIGFLPLKPSSFPCQNFITVSPCFQHSHISSLNISDGKSSN